MASNTVIVFPQRLSPRYGFGEILPVISLWHFLGGVEGQSQKYQQEENTSPVIDISCHAFGKAFGHGVFLIFKKMNKARESIVGFLRVDIDRNQVFK